MAPGLPTWTKRHLYRNPPGLPHQAEAPGGIQPHGLNSYPVQSLSHVQTAIVGLISLNQESQANYILLSVLSLWRTLVCAQDGEDPVWSI